MTRRALLSIWSSRRAGASAGATAGIAAETQEVPPHVVMALEDAMLLSAAVNSRDSRLMPFRWSDKQIPARPKRYGMSAYAVLELIIHIDETVRQESGRSGKRGSLIRLCSEKRQIANAGVGKYPRSFKTNVVVFQVETPSILRKRPARANANGCGSISVPKIVSDASVCGIRSPPARGWRWNNLFSVANSGHQTGSDHRTLCGQQAKAGSPP